MKTNRNTNYYVYTLNYNWMVNFQGEALLAAIDVAKPGNSKIRQMYNITGFPTLLYYE